ncbi:MAG: Virulence-associated protein E [Candidatus Nomurabacteria bacterium GW2011_GWB1_37_5]|uniref:Virulence-associated protein E n=1 Tax=Candidatus Nomurabacteria bacterium GW2011_GWB1_37_5 TaxID=1618742 RepID=A0A0G0GX30_9BACT|nr:MAG: Virulence-associated protein E [Candidatus Nomurabacteria bacterium GW2011_GWB1_37_5]
MPDQLLLGIDIDHCLEGNVIMHEQKESITQLIKEADTYVEISPSNTGLHLFLSLTAPLQLIANRQRDFEAYTSGRYFTVTENPYKESKPIRIISPDEAKALLAIIGYPWGKEKIQQNHLATTVAVSLDDATVLSKMFSSKNGNKIKALYAGDVSIYKEDDSSADMALCSHLAFWTARNPTQMERIWLASPLGSRGKTQERKDYRDRTIDTAIKNCTEVYGIQTKNTVDKNLENIKEMEIVSWGEFSKKEFPEARWRIKDLIPMEGFVILSAISGEKKTWVSLEMAKCISQGVDFLSTNIFKTEQGKILYVDQENPERDIVRRGKKLGIKENGNFFLYRPDSLNLNEEKVANEFLKLIVNNDIKVVFVDTLRAVAGGLKEDKAEDVRMFFNRFKILKDTGVAIIWLDHRRKPLNFEGKVPKKEQLLGSQDKTASVEILLQLSSESGSDEIRVYQAKNRLDKEIPAFKILMKDSVAEDGIETITLGYDGIIEEDETKKDEAKENILALLRESEKTTKEILDVLSRQKIGSKNSRAGLKELFEEGKIDMAKRGKQNLYFLVQEKTNESDIKDDLGNF